MQFPWITALTLLPLLGGLLVLGLDAGQRKLARGLALGISLLVLAGTMILFAGFDRSIGAPQFVERHSWIPTLGVDYFVGIDGLGLMMVFLSALVVPLALLASWQITEKTPIFFSLALFIETGLIGSFTALNFFHWFFFWELGLIPAFFLIKVWGGRDRSRAATQFFIYTMTGSVAMLVAFAAIVFATGSSDFLHLADLARSGSLKTSLAKLTWPGLTADRLAWILFAGIFLAFAVKVPLMPFHSWLPSAYAEAPTGATILLTGAMSKMGVYGFLRILAPLFPDEMRSVLTPLLWLAVATIVCSAGAAFAQKDLKRILAYSSINHLGYCLLGVFAALKQSDQAGALLEKSAALNGVILQMFNHGLTASALFCFIAFIERRAGGLRGIGDFGGLRKVAPVFCGLMGIAVFASLGLPGLNGFVGEFLIFKGAFALASWAVALSSLGLLLSAIFLLTMLQKVFHGPLRPEWVRFGDLQTSERWVVIPATALMFLFGIYPQLLVGFFNATVTQLVVQISH